jgi:Winged helix DNA-binding domain
VPGPLTPRPLTRRALNRATLSRQLLLDRAAMPAAQVIEHLGGLQAQAPLAPYVGLWTRLAGFTPDELSTLISERTVVRAHLMRSTVHLLTAPDYLRFRPLYVRLGERELRAHFGSRLGDDIDVTQVRDRARVLLAEGPLTRAQLGKLLAPSWPDADPATLAYAASYQLSLIQVPPRGLWGKNGPAAWALADAWLAGARPGDDGMGAIERLVLRAIGSFGPMTVNDLQQWSGLSRLREVTERLAGQLITVRSEDGAELLDLPEAPRPDPDVPAPPRFLPEYDNLLLSHADRSRVIPDGRPVPLPPGNGASQGTLLIDGDWSATWQLADGVLHVRSFGTLRGKDRDEIETEGSRLLDFVGARDIRFSGPALR